MSVLRRFQLPSIDAPSLTLPDSALNAPYFLSLICNVQAA